MLSVQLNTYGSTDVIVVDVPPPGPPAQGEVLVGMMYAPVNHNDLFVLQGVFPVHPELPSPVGNEGVGRVLAVGPGVNNVKVGDLVLPPLYSLTWREQLLVPAKELFPLSSEADPRQLAMLRINPVTAALLLSEYKKLEPGDWIIQNAGTSAVARSVIAIAKSHGFKTISLVRRADAVDELKSVGGDEVFLDEDDSLERIAAATGGSPLKLALDGVGGSNAGRLASALSPGGVLVAYALMGGELISSVGILDLIFKDITYRGFYQDRREFDQATPTFIKEAAALIASGKLSVPVAAVYELKDVKKAIEHVQSGGKVLLKIAEA
jgi:NADPH:quinone reductase-like Zn-dependent oxidoreductase